MPSFIEIGPPVPEKNIFEGFFYHIYGHGGHHGYVTWIIYVHIAPPPLPIDASHNIWLWLAKWFQRSLKSVDAGQMPGACLSYKLTFEPQVS